MENCPGCNNSSTTYTRCNPPVSTNCVFYQGESIVCENDNTFTICKGDSMSAIQADIFNKICTLTGDINVTSIKFPCSLQDAWESKNKTVLDLLQYMVNIQCAQQTSITDLTIALPLVDPIVSVCLQCCGIPCGSPTVHLSEALTNIISCICTLKGQVDQANLTAASALDRANTAYNRIYDPINGLNKQITNLSADNVCTKIRLCIIETQLLENTTVGKINGCSTCSTCGVCP